MNDVVSRFIEYTKIFTESDEHVETDTTPSTQRQFDLAHILVAELKALGIDNAHVDDTCYVYASIPATPGCEDLPAVGLIAHMDTTPDLTGENVKAQIIHYEGGDIVLNRELDIVMKAEQFPFLSRFVGQDLICTDGTTLLGADDKAGIAMIMQGVEEILASGTPHGPIRIGFTPDEEIGMGADNFDVKGFDADFAFTLDGGDIREYQYETFNAAQAAVKINGFSIHPGTAKDKMKNAALIAMDFNALLPPLETPAHTEGYQGFFHLVEMEGRAEDASMTYIIRDHSMERFQERKRVMEEAALQINRRYGEGTVELEIRDQYFNMYEILKDHMEVVALAEAAMKAAGVENPTHPPIRGGTDGCQLTYMGLLCPNLPAAGYNAHGRFEFCPVEELKMGVKIVKNLLCPQVLRENYLKKEA